MDSGYGKISEEELNKLRKRIGVEIPWRQPYIEEITKDAIRHFAHGIGDTNPLWTDEGYASHTQYKTLIAPPCILYSTDLIVSGNVGGLPGVHALFAGTNWEWFLPIKLGDRISASSYLSRLEEKRSEFAGRTFLQCYETSFRNQDKEIVARAESFCIRSERDTAREKGKYRAITPEVYTPEQLKAIEADYDREEIRGSKPRYWEEVEPGDNLTPIVKGPLTVTDMIAWLRGWGGLFIRAHRLGLDYRRRHPSAAIPNSQGVPDVPERVHWENEFAQQIGAPAAYDYGPQRISWLSQLITNWMGDDGFLKKLEVEVRRFNIVGDTTWCRGKATHKYQQGDQSMVECQVWAENQRGEITAQGRALIILPNKNQQKIK
jgi:acyl dehydratase